MVAGILWLKFKPLISLTRACMFAITLVIMFKVGESVPNYYAKYLLVWI